MRASGILLHPTSLPGQHTTGDLGTEGFEFVDLLVQAGQSYWQILPLNPPGYGNSPYSAYSAYAGNTSLISPAKLAEDGLLQSGEFSCLDLNGRSVALASAFEKFQASPESPLRSEFDYFLNSNSWWLDDFAIYCALKTAHKGKPWYEWPAQLKMREATAIDAIGSELAREILAEKFYQYIFFRQWLAVKRYANEKGIRIIGDIPIFVALDSVDVWCNRDMFKLEPDGSPTVVAGVPPDYFSKTGQRWGNPIYRWETMSSDDFGWWTARIAFNLETLDTVRLDHFIGFSRNWEIPAGEDTAENGRWVDVPGADLLSTLKRRLGDISLIAEDLGSMTPEVEALRDAFGLPGMRILQYGFGGDADNRDLPHNYISNTVAYTGTHDNNTTAGWYRAAPKNVRAHCRKYLGSNGRAMHWDMIDVLLASVADTAIIPMQDVLGLGSEHRMNTPATTRGNWSWRLEDGAFTSEIAARLRERVELFGRAAGLLEKD